MYVCRRDLLDHVIKWNERHLKRLMSEFRSTPLVLGRSGLRGRADSKRTFRPLSFFTREIAKSQCMFPCVLTTSTPLARISVSESDAGMPCNSYLPGSVSSEFIVSFHLVQPLCFPTTRREHMCRRSHLTLCARCAEVDFQSGKLIVEKSND